MSGSHPCCAGHPGPQRGWVLKERSSQGHVCHPWDAHCGTRALTCSRGWRLYVPGIGLWWGSPQPLACPGIGGTSPAGVLREPPKASEKSLSFLFSGGSSLVQERCPSAPPWCTAIAASGDLINQPTCLIRCRKCS